MLADFKITIHSQPLRTVRVAIYEDVKALRRAAKRHDRMFMADGDFSDVVGLCQRYAVQGRDGNLHADVATVRLAPPHIGIGVVTHEIAHACVWLWELDHPDEKLDLSNDEPFAWLMGELVRQTVNKMYEHKVWEDSPTEPDGVQAVRSLVN